MSEVSNKPVKLEIRNASFGYNSSETVWEDINIKVHELQKLDLSKKIYTDNNDNAIATNKFNSSKLNTNDVIAPINKQI